MFRIGAWLHEPRNDWTLVLNLVPTAETTKTKMAKGERCRNEENDSPDLDQYAKDALDEVFNKEEQSYEEFLQGFTFLKKGEDALNICSHGRNSIY